MSYAAKRSEQSNYCGRERYTTEGAPEPWHRMTNLETLFFFCYFLNFMLSLFKYLCVVVLYCLYTKRHLFHLQSIAHKHWLHFYKFIPLPGPFYKDYRKLHIFLKGVPSYDLFFSFQMTDIMEFCDSTDNFSATETHQCSPKQTKFFLKYP